MSFGGANLRNPTLAIDIPCLVLYCNLPTVNCKTKEKKKTFFGFSAGHTSQPTGLQRSVVAGGCLLAPTWRVMTWLVGIGCSCHRQR